LKEQDKEVYQNELFGKASFPLLMS
jgi:hypothetical protein